MRSFRLAFRKRREYPVWCRNIVKRCNSSAFSGTSISELRSTRTWEGDDSLAVLLHFVHFVLKGHPWLRDWFAICWVGFSNLQDDFSYGFPGIPLSSCEHSGKGPHVLSVVLIQQELRTSRKSCLECFLRIWYPKIYYITYILKVEIMSMRHGFPAGNAKLKLWDL